MVATACIHVNHDRTRGVEFAIRKVWPKITG